MATIRIVRNFDNPDSDDIDLEIDLDEYSIDLDDPNQVAELERMLMLTLERVGE